jgi:short-subunit dehydrogenase
LITGASSGLGEDFAYALAREKYDLVLTARREDRLKQIAEKARQLGASKVTIIPLDLGQPDAPGKLQARTAAEGIEVDYLINNAGFGTNGRFDQLPLDREIEQIDLNVRALVQLTHLYLPQMVARKRGTIINVASTAAFQSVPWMATYAATKAFVLSFSQALWGEVGSLGLTILALCPGPTRTGFQNVAGVNEAKVPSVAYMSSETVVRQALSAAKRRKSICINGPMNFLMAEASRIAPRSLVARIAGTMFRPPAAQTT